MRRIRLAYWTCLLTLCATGATVSQPTHDALVGTWRGSAMYQGARLEFGVHFFREGSVLRAAMSCPDFFLLEQPLDSVYVTGRSVRFATPDERPVRFEGTLEGDSLRGTAAVPGVPGVVDPARAAQPLRFALGRNPPAAAPPYQTREVHVRSGAVQLAGTLYSSAAPRGDQAGIVLLQGSSTNLRRDYRFYADHFARAGLAVLAFDKRGNGESTGDYSTATYEDLVADAAAAVEFLGTQPGVDRDRVGVWGLSQGAFIAPLVSARVRSLRFIVAVSAPGAPIGETAAYQDSVRLISAGYDAADVRRTVSINRRLYEWLRAGTEQGELVALLREAADTPWRRASSLPTQLPTGAVLQSWYWRGRTLDPLPSWQATRVPVLAVYGAADELLPARSSARSVERALRKGGNHDATVRVFPAANHVIRTLPLVAGSKWDWPRAAPGYLESVTNWMLSRSRSPAKPASR